MGIEIDAIVHNLFFQGGEVKILNIKSHVIVQRYYTVISTLMSISRSCRAQAYELLAGRLFTGKIVLICNG